MPGGIVTNRPLQNEATGIDLQVPLYQEIRGPMISGHVEYQIVVVTRLDSFKSAKHRTGDVVQFVVSKTYSEIEEFYYDLRTKYPNIQLPPMPRKALFVSESDLQKRRAAFDELVRFFSKHPTLSNCPEILQFLGATTNVKNTNKPDSLDNDEDDTVDFFDRVELNAMTMTVETSEQRVNEEQKEAELLHPLSSEPIKKHADPRKASPGAKVAPKSKSKTLFDEEDEPEETVKDDATLFISPHSGDTDTSLLTKFSNSANSIEPVDKDIEELFRVEEDLDRLLAVSNTVKRRQDGAEKPKPKPKVKVKPGSTSFSQAKDLQDMDQMDIIQYIQQNHQTASQDLDLFKP